ARRRRGRWASPSGERRARGACSASRRLSRSGASAIACRPAATMTSRSGVGMVELLISGTRTGRGRVRFAVPALGAGAGLGDAGQLQAPAGQAKSQGGAVLGRRVGPDAAVVGLDQ